MNPHKSFRSAMAWLHTWSGLLLGWILYAIFITGSAAYFRPEITAWMQPETAAVSTPSEAARTAFLRLSQTASDAKRWIISVPDARSRELKILWQPAAGGRFQNETLPPSSTQNVPPRATLGGEFFYRFHFQLMLPHPWGRYLASLAALFMLVALISGIVTHRRFFKDLFLLRLGRNGRRPWLDFHNVTAVLALPFYLIISYSALVIFTPMILPLAGKFINPATSSATEPASGSASPAPRPAPGATSWITIESFDRMLAHVETTWGSPHSFKRVDLAQRGTPKATVSFTRADGTAISHLERETLKFSGITGIPLENSQPKPSRGARVRGLFYGLHLAHFAGPALRTLCFLMGLMGAAMIATGLVLWTLKRKDRFTESGLGGRFGYGLVSRLNITAITGLPIACAGFLWANRLIPVGQASRTEAETTCFLVVWSAAALHAFVRQAKFAWTEQCLAAAFAFGALPFIDFSTAGYQLDTWPRVDVLYIYFTTTLLLLGILFAYGAYKIGIRSTRTVSNAGSL
jgi:uncharacterized iron-regulated membrane protein